jgi:hypothetical protein
MHGTGSQQTTTGKGSMESTLIRSPFVLFVMTMVTGGLAALSIPALGWLISPLLIASLAYAVLAAFFTTRYTTYHLGLDWLLKLNFCLFVIFMNQTAFEQWFSQRIPMAISAAYLVLLAAVYVLGCRMERQTNWSKFDQTRTSPTLVITKGKVQRIVRSRTNAKRKSSSRNASNIGAGLGVAALGMVGAVFGARGKELLVLVVVTGFMAAPFVWLRYLVVYGVGIREVRKVERERGERFELDNAAALQEARRKMFFARLLNPRLRQQV